VLSLLMEVVWPFGLLTKSFYLFWFRLEFFSPVSECDGRGVAKFGIGSLLLPLVLIF
jgi:hypothetical protein